MKFLERLIKSTELSSEEIVAMEKDWEAVEDEIGGFPKKRMYGAWFAKVASYTYVFEREWNTLAEYEAAYAKLFQHPKAAELAEKYGGSGKEYREIYYTIGD